MVDTLKLMAGVDQYRLHPVAGKWERQTVTDSASGEIMREKSYCNLPRLNMSVDAAGILVLSASAPKLLHGSSLSEVREEDRERFVSTVAEQAHSTGLEVDPGSLRVLRVDYCRNLSVRRRTRDYLSLLQQYTMSRRTKRSFDGETVLFANGSRQFCSYDKLLEVRASAELAKDGELLRQVESDPRKNLLRCESRLLRAKPVGRVAGVEVAHLADVWRSELSREVLLSDFDAVTSSGDILPPIDFQSLVDTLSKYRELFPRGGAFRVVEVDGLRHLLAACRGDWQLLRCALEESGYCSRHVRRILSRWRETFRASVPEDASGLLREIRGKLAA